MDSNGIPRPDYSSVIEKEFKYWFDTCKMEMSIERNMQNAWNACAMLMADRVKELEAEINQRDNEIKTIRAISNGMLKENEKLKKELDEATEIIKDEICKVWEKGCERRERAEQFLSSLDKPIKEDR